ncbi:MAG: amino acid racemase, partial [Candidatus Aenigmarchaeota archaeon]|nr:amino acid racemase [Candidatus Aenigmarchaeota archaeon]
MKKYKKIGVIGGMGPESTIIFYQEIVRVFQNKFNAKYDSDYPEMMISNLPIPDVVENLQNPNAIIEMIKENSKKLESAGMDFIAIPCNTVNLFYDMFSRSVSIPILNIIEETVKKVKSAGYKKVGLLATETTIKN